MDLGGFGGGFGGLGGGGSTAKQFGSSTATATLEGDRHTRTGASESTLITITAIGAVALLLMVMMIVKR